MPQLSLLMATEPDALLLPHEDAVAFYVPPAAAGYGDSGGLGFGCWSHAGGFDCSGLQQAMKAAGAAQFKISDVTASRRALGVSSMLFMGLAPVVAGWCFCRRGGLGFGCWSHAGGFNCSRFQQALKSAGAAGHLHLQSRLITSSVYMFFEPMYTV
jgi:hypothetical protein